MALLTAPLAEIKRNGKTIGWAKGITVTENTTRIIARGLGNLNGKEACATAWDGKCTVDSFYLKWDGSSGVPGAVNRNTNSIQDFVDTVTLQEEGLSITLFTKETDTVNAQTGIIKGKLKENITISGMFNESENMTLSEGQIAGHNQTFVYLNPVLNPE